MRERKETEKERGRGQREEVGRKEDKGSHN
jgi:hypothetical protein